MKCDRTVLTPRKSLTDNAVETIKTVTAKMKTLPVGTYKYEIFKYPGDIDLFEKLSFCCSYNEARLRTAHELRKITKKILANKDVIFVELKAGYDIRFKIYTGIIENGTIYDFNKVIVQRDLNKLLDACLLTKEQHNTLTKLCSVEDVMRLNEELREFWVLRWSSQEILQGFKLLPGKYRLYLDEAVTQGSIVKMDTIAKVDDRYVEVTNFFLVSQIDRFGNKIILSEELKDYETSLLQDVYKYYETKPYKAIKRLWMYLAFKKRICDLSIFKDLFDSDIAFYSQILADVETAIRLQTLPHDKAFLKQSLSKRLSYVKHICPLDNLESIKVCLENTIRKMTFEWLATNDIDIFKLIN